MERWTALLLLELVQRGTETVAAAAMAVTVAVAVAAVGLLMRLLGLALGPAHRQTG